MAFKEFPEFSEITVADRDAYNVLIKDYPPISDISFPGLLIWWGVTKRPRIALLNGNLVIDYSLDEDRKNSGLSLIGTKDVDQAVCIILDYLRTVGRPSRLVHVPEFVINSLQYPELFSFKSERRFDEYIMAISRFHPIEKSSIHHQRRIVRFLERTHGSQLRVGALNLDRVEDRLQLLDGVARWPRKGVNNISEHSRRALEAAINGAPEVGLKNVCLFVDDVLHSFVLFQPHADKRYVMVEYAMLSYGLPDIMSFAVSTFAEWFAEHDIVYVNLVMDFGSPIRRIPKIALSPVNFFRKYTVEPTTSLSIDSLKALGSNDRLMPL